MSGTLALASTIAEMDRDALRALVARRRPQAAGTIADPIGLAAELLRSDSITRAIVPLERNQLSALLRFAAAPRSCAPDELQPLTALGLIGRESEQLLPLDEVTETVRDALISAGIEPDSLTAVGATPDAVTASHTSGATPAPEPTPRATAAVPHQAPDTSTWYSPALTAVGQAAESLRVLTLRPGKLNRNGTVAVASLRSLAEATSIDVDSVSRIVTALGHAGLTTPRSDEQLLLVSAAAGDWLAQDNRDRWLTLARATLAAIPAPLNIALTAADGDLAGAAAAIPHRFPLLPPAELAAATAFTAVAEQLGLTVSGVLSAPADRLIADDPAAAGELVARDTPGLAPGVYVQPDLSVVVPGPLAPADEATLSAISRPEQIGVASTRRISEASLAEGLEQGVTPDAARALFGRISLTGIPQPLEYLLASRAERIGDLVVDEHDGDVGRTRITVSRSDLAQTLLVDRALQHLQLTRPAPAPNAPVAMGTPIRLYSRLRADHVVSALTDARYHPTTSAALSGAGRAPGTRGASPAHTLDTAAIPIVDVSAAPQATQLTEAYSTLVERVYLAARAEPGTGEFTRRLELAMRDRSPVYVTAEARGQVRTFTLLPVSVTSGRLRATDQVAGVERTLPVNMITAVEPV
ncbi:XPB/Ssl2-like helicase family protein [Leucobacter luti]|uniref:XPB/Ssl2-like helicase family protein n=1 Tax=Leucobacter luti TaxID=340320 RepID=A0A4R6S724_9MICO|nr:helicase-associated domain-containing protein [Leucobacter luti]TDP95600.1 XPB/Ssl2-like helicase family protein [Leucobacter luti]